MTGLEDNPCKGCRTSVRISRQEVDRIIAAHFAGAEVALAGEATEAARLALCRDLKGVIQ